MIQGDWTFHHCGMIVADAEAACAQFRDLGFEILEGPYTTPEKSPENPQTSKVVWIRKDAITFEILQPLQGRWVNRTFLDTHGDGVNHVCFTVADLAAEKARMEAAGYPAVYGFTVPKGSFAYFDTRRNGNLMIELLQPAAAAVP